MTMEGICERACIFLLLSCFVFGINSSAPQVDWSKTEIWGPGLKAGFWTPARHFYVQLKTASGENITESAGENPFDVKMSSASSAQVRVYLRVLDKKDGLYIVNYRLFESQKEVEISVLKNAEHLGKSPFILKGYTHPESCYCPESSLKKWYKNMQCAPSFTQIDSDLSPFKEVDLDKASSEIIQRFNISTAHSLSRYRIIDNKIYRKTYGQHVGFKMFSDAILLSLTKKVKLPDIEIFVNLGDWPLERRGQTDNPVPIFSWCGSDDTSDIVMPTYDLTGASLDMMGRQSLDVFHVMGRSPAPWAEKEEKGFWRGRDSRQERLDLVVMSRSYPDDLDAKMTRMFFFKHDQEKYGDLVQNIPFFDFFKYKYQVTLDGTVAAYRFPYLLAGDSVVLKQDSPYYEHFYKELEPYIHYVPIQRDISDLREKIQWARDNDDKVREISRNAQNFVLQKLTPEHILCYHVKLFEEFSKRLAAPPAVPDESWELVEQPEDHNCICKQKDVTKKSKKSKDEL